MSYRPITDVWILARSKTKYYGAFPAGFLERARALLGIDYEAHLLHVCGGRVRNYPFKRYTLGPNERTIDVDSSLNPDYVGRVDRALPSAPTQSGKWDACLADPPYSPGDAEHYLLGAEVYPSPRDVLRCMLDAVKPGGRVGILHYEIPRPPADTRFVACVGVIVGFGNRIRVFSVFERARQLPGDRE